MRETLVRGFAAVVVDLRETQTALPADSPVLAALTDRLRYFEWEGHYLRGQYPATKPDYDDGQYLIQHLRERVHHQGTNDVLRDDYDGWLETHKIPHFRSHDAWRHAHDPALIRIFEGHKSLVNAVAFAPDGRAALSGSNDGTVRLWDIASGAELHRFEGHKSGVIAVAFTPDGHSVLSGSDDGGLMLWDVASGVERRRFEGHFNRVTAVAFAPDGHTALSGSGDHTLRLWDVASGVELRRFEGHSDAVNAVAFAPDGHTALSGSYDRTLRLWDVTSGAQLAMLRLDAPLLALAVAATTPPLVVVGDQGGGVWVLSLHVPA